MIKRLSLYTLLLCLVPFFVWIFAWQWIGDTNLTAFDEMLYWLTETGSVPYAAITSAVFVFLLMWLAGDKKYYKLIFITCVISVVSTQAIKEGAKNLFAEPRPFVVQIEHQSGITDEQFYSIPRSEREKIVAQFYADKTQTPQWLKMHRQNETGYSFPSGHTIFAAAWLLLFGGFAYLLRGKSRSLMPAAVGLIALWAVLMLISRLRLGMHYPVDLFVAIMISWLINAGIFSWVKKRLI